MTFNEFWCIINIENKGTVKRSERGFYYEKDLIAKIVNTVCNSMFVHFHGVSKVSIDFDTAHKNGLASSISDCLQYVELTENGYKDDIIFSYTEYDNGINVYTTIHNKEHKVIGYSYKFCVRCEKKNQIEVTTELMMCIYQALNMCE